MRSHDTKKGVADAGAHPRPLNGAEMRLAGGNAMRPHKGSWVACLVLLGTSWGCAMSSLPPSPPPSASEPFLRATSEDMAQLALLASDLDPVAHDCTSKGTCTDEVQFSRALMSLFENREAARASFEQVMTRHPSSPLVGPSALWLQLLQDDGMSSRLSDPQRRMLTELSAHWAREWIGRRLSVSPRAVKKDAHGRPVSINAYQQQLQEKDRRIAELRFQLDALKVIDQDQADRYVDRSRKARTPRIENQR
jgi:hypothetical protein